MVRYLFAVLVALFLMASPDLAWAGGLDLNSATVEQLDGLPGIGPSKAQAIVDWRTQNGGFKSIEQLMDVPGIGDATFANLKALVAVGGAVAPAPAKVPAPVAAAEPAAPLPAAEAPLPANPVGAAGRVNINTADASALKTLPGIGDTKAQAIIADRTSNGPFASCQDLGRVKGIGPATVAALLDLCATK